VLIPFRCHARSPFEVATLFREIKLTSSQASGPCIYWYFVASLIVIYNIDTGKFSLYVARRRCGGDDDE
jgi:hypothetical protein